MVAFVLIAVPAIIIFAGLGLFLKSPHTMILGKIIFEFREYERAVVYRFGKFHRTLGAGWQFIVPVIDSFVKYDMRTEAVDIPPQEVITKGGVKLYIDAVMYLKVDDPVKAELNVEQDYRKAIEEYIKGRIRNVIGSMELTHLYAKIGDINEQLKNEVQEVTTDWGVTILDVELINVKPPDQVVAAMEAEEIARRYKEAELEKAKGMQHHLNAIRESAGQLNEQALSYLYMQTLKEMAHGKANKIIFPMELTKAVQNISNTLGNNPEAIEGMINSLTSKVSKKAQ